MKLVFFRIKVFNRSQALISKFLATCRAAHHQASCWQRQRSFGSICQTKSEGMETEEARRQSKEGTGRERRKRQSDWRQENR